MSFRSTALKRSLLAGLLLGLLTGPAFPQAKDSPLVFSNLDGVTVSFVSAPSLGGGGGNTGNQWLKVEFHYALTMPPTQGDYLPAATFKVWIEGRDLLDPLGKPGVGIAIALTGVETYVNIHQGRDIYGVFYVHPNSLGRYSTAGGANDFDKKFNVHVEAQIGDALADYFDKNKETDLTWYKQLKVIPGLVYRQDQCGFIVDNPDRYPPLVLSSGAL